MIPREILPLLEKSTPPRAVTVFGPRRCGKTTLLKYLVRDYDCDWYNGDFPQSANQLTIKSESDAEVLLRKSKAIVIDEAQRVPNIGLILKILVDKNIELGSPTKIFVSGSSSLELAKGVKESAAGRLSSFNLWPISTSELCDADGKSTVRRNLESHIVFGMFPLVLREPDCAIDILTEYCESILFKDILALSNIRKPEVLSNLLIFLARAIGSEISYDSLSRGLGISKTTVISYVDLLEECFLIKRCKAFSDNYTNELTKNQKIYFCDTGLRNAILQDFSPFSSRSDAGALWENFVFMELVKKQDFFKTHALINFWRTRKDGNRKVHEVDFVEVKNHRPEHAFECKLTEKARTPRPEEFLKLYPACDFKKLTPESYL